jgi:hypothetical protein
VIYPVKYSPEGEGAGILARKTTRRQPREMPHAFFQPHSLGAGTHSRCILARSLQDYLANVGGNRGDNTGDSTAIHYCPPFFPQKRKQKKKKKGGGVCMLVSLLTKMLVVMTALNQFALDQNPTSSPSFSLRPSNLA